MHIIVIEKILRCLEDDQANASQANAGQVKNVVVGVPVPVPNVEGVIVVVDQNNYK